MLELLFCSLFTLLPDYLYRRYGQGKRLGHEITVYSVWYELRWGITGCLMLTIALITVVFYNHPSTAHATGYFRTLPILPETNGRVAEIFVGFSDNVEKGAPLFRLDDSRQKAALEVAVRKIAEVEAEMAVAQADLAATEGRIEEAKGAYNQAVDELETKQELQRRNPDVVTRREIERLQRTVEGRQGAVAATEAAKQATLTRISTLLPAEKASAQAELQQAQVDLNKTVISAGVAGRVEQFVLRVGDIVNPLMRPAGVLVPAGAGREAIIAGFGQIEAQVISIGMAAEVACASKPWVIIPMVVTSVQDYISAGQVRASEQLIDPQHVTRPGTLTVILEPLFEGGLQGVTPGSSCIANAYTNNHELLARKDLGSLQSIYLHIVDTVSIVHAMILRLQALVYPIQTLVLGGH
jgi:multidrug resistance efflux pump